MYGPAYRGSNSHSYYFILDRLGRLFRASKEIRPVHGGYPRVVQQPFPHVITKGEFEHNVANCFLVKIAGKGNLPSQYEEKEKEKYRRNFSTFYKN